MSGGSQIQKLIVELEYRSNSLKNQVNKDMAVLKTQATKLQKEMSNINLDKRFTVDTKKVKLHPLKKQMAEIRQEMGLLGATTKTTMAGMSQGINENKKKMKGMIKPFEGYALSMMFFGMAIQKMFTQIWQTGMKTFQEVMHSVEGTVTSFDILDGSVKYLGFTIGQALEPLAAAFVPIIDAVTDWVGNNEQLSRSIFVIGSAVGGLLFLFGILKLGITGIISGFNLLFGVDMAASIIKQGGLIKMIAVKLGLVSAAATKSAAAMALLVPVAIIMLIFWLGKLAHEMGGVDQLVKSVVRGILNAFFMLAGGVAGVFMEIINLLKGWWNRLVTDFENTINWVIKGLNKLGFGISEVNFDKAKFDVKNFGDAFKGAYGEVMALNAALQETKLLAPEKGWATGFSGGMPTYQTTQLEDLMTAIPDTSVGSSDNMSSYVAPPTQVTQYNNITIEGTSMSTDDIMAEFDRIVTRNVGE